jgi:hypothetical protein
VPLIQAEKSALLSGTALCRCHCTCQCKIPRWRSESWAGTIPLQVWVEALRQHCSLEDELLTHAKLGSLHHRDDRLRSQSLFSHRVQEKGNFEPEGSDFSISIFWILSGQDTLPQDSGVCLRDARACLQVTQELGHDLAYIALVAHGKEQVQAAPPDGDVRVLQAVDDALSVPARPCVCQIHNQALMW